MPKIFENIADEYAKYVVSLEDFHLFLDMKDQVLSDETKADFIRSAESYLNVEYETILAHSYMRYEKNGDRSIYEGECMKRRRMVLTLFFGEYVERKGRFLEKLIINNKINK